MESGKNKINSYKDLLVWQKSHKLALNLYKLSKLRRKSFSDIEIWRQSISAGFSVSANIVEVYHSHRGKNFASHLEIARGSAAEVSYWLEVLKEISQIGAKDAEEMIKEYGEVVAMLTGLIGKIRK